MEKRKESLSVLKLCRFCLSQNQSLGSLYDKRLTPKNSVELPLKILSCVSVEVFPSDKMPPYICSYCNFFMDMFYKYKHIVRQADENILKYVQNGTALESVSWPTSLLKAFQNSVRHEVVKTVVEGGTTVQVTTHEVSDSEEEEEENVYNVTIADGSDDGSKSVSTIKVVTSKDGQDSPQNQSEKGFSSVKKIVRHVRPQQNDRPYICKHCSKTFTKSHHYTRHLRLKHGENIRSSRGPFGQPDQYRCDQCDDSFSTQDELIYHSAIHATQNLICPLCQEKFPNVDAVTTHIKSHVNGVEFMCDFCELVFTTKDKLESHIIMMHEDEFNNELGQDESSEEMDAREDDEDNDNGLNVKDEGDHMLIEIKKADEYMLHNTQEDMEEKFDNTNSEDSEPEVTYTELSTVDTLRIIKKEDIPQQMSVDNQSIKNTMDTISTIPAVATNDQQIPAVIRKAEEVKQKQSQQAAETEKKEKSIKSESNSVGASNKSLQILEKELQELKRTNNPRSDVSKTAKSNEQIRGRRPQLHTSTPKTKSVEEKKTTNTVTKTTAIEKKTQQERRLVTKENKEPKESKDKVNSSNKEEKEVKDKEAAPTAKSVVKNGNNEKNVADEGIRRSTRPSKVKDYAKMIRDKPDDEDSDDADDDEEYKADKTPEKRGRKSVTKVQPKMIQTTISSTNQSKMGLSAITTPTPRKRGRPRKEPPKEVPAKVKKDEIIEEINLTKTDTEDSPGAAEKDVDSKISNSSENSSDAVKIVNTEQAHSSRVLVSPTGQTLKKVPIKALPPGVKPLPLPVSSRAVTGEVCEMQIGKKLVKVQKIVMTKAEVEAMAKKGLVEMKDGTMVLKPGIKLPSSDPISIKSSLVGDKDVLKESAPKREKGAPSRCDLGDDS